MRLFSLLIGLLVCYSFTFEDNVDIVDSGSISVTVLIQNVRNKNGRIQLQIYRDQTTFSKETPWKVVYVTKENLKDNKLTHTIKGLHPGVYGFALLDDENKNKQMDYGWMMPKEGFGFSDYYHTAWSKPEFNDFKFYLKENKKTTMKIRYL